MEARKLNLTESKQTPHTSNSTQEKVKNTLTEEIIIGICSPIGCDKKEVVEYLKRKLEQGYKYDEVKVIKLSDFLTNGKIDFSDFKFDRPKNCTKHYEEYLKLIQKGNYLRKKYNNSILSELAVESIYTKRIEPLEKNGEIAFEKLRSRRVCYIIDSIKHREELALFRSIYRESFYQMSIYSPIKHRETIMMRKKKLAIDEFERIVDIDLKEDENYGQEVVKVFQEADFFLRVDSNTTEVVLKKRIDRYLHLIFQSQVVTPTTGETAMYQAKSAACNSACLSRQVGAAIIDKNGTIVSTGWNDVPKYGGGLYKEMGKIDNRCIHSGNQCMNSLTKNNIVQSLISKLVENGCIENKNIVKAILTVQKTEIADLTEFSRAVHAEMHAIIQGAHQSGDKMRGGKLYCTTYPCHNCARHIVVAGIKEIYYIEPYRKSRCLELHSDSMTEDEYETDKVRILMFDGVSPNRYLEFFKAGSRKDGKGKGYEFNDLSKAKPKTMLSLQALPTLEAQAVQSLEAMGLSKK